MFEVLKRDGIARIGKWKLQKNVSTPNILFITTNRIKQFEHAEIFLTTKEIKTSKPYIINKGRNFINMDFSNGSDNENFIIPKHIIFPTSCRELYEDFEIFSNEKLIIQTKEKIINKDVELHILPNSLELLKNPRKFLEKLVKLRKEISYQSLIYTPGIGEPHTLALFVYLGIDLFDSLQLIFNARKGYFLTENGKMQKDEIDEIPCYCPSCRNSKLDFENLLNHNYFTALQEMKKIRNAIRNEKLRELVEQRIRAEPFLVSILRIFDFEYFKFQEKFFPISRKSRFEEKNGRAYMHRLICTSLESFSRPEVKRFCQRIKNRYNKPEFAKILLLLPCSAKKPYSFSKSHILFRRTIKNSINPSIIHEVIVTSPLGIVPREIEIFYPAQNYDISVTGRWDLEEIDMIQKLLRNFLKNNKYDKIISHLPNNMDFISEVLDDFLNTCVDNPTSKISLENLRKTLNEVCKPYEKINNQIRINQMLKNIAIFQFGKAGRKILEDAVVKGRYPNLKIFKNCQLAMLTKERGMLSLTIEGAKILAKEKVYFVKIDNFKPKGSVFAVGVLNAYPKIRIGDDVVVMHEEELRGVGIALMSAKEMVESNRGMAIKIRHYC